MGVLCQILIHRPYDGFHRAGQIVKGVVKYAVNKPTEYNTITLFLIGKGISTWSEYNSNDTTTTHSGKEEYITEYVELLKPSRFSTIVPKGSYEYHFQFKLRKNIPSSWKDNICTINYRIKMKFVKLGLFNTTKRFYAELPVRGYVNPTMVEGPIMFGLRKTIFKPFSANYHEVDLKAQINNTVFKPSDAVKVNYILTNKSNVEVKGIVTSIVCHDTYTSDYKITSKHKKQIKESVVKTQIPIPRGTVSVEVPIPSRVYSIQNSKIMLREYKVTVDVQLPMPHKNAQAEIPIIIGERHIQEYDNFDEGSSFLESVTGYS